MFPLWVYVAVPLAFVVLLAAAYRTKKFDPLPPSKPKIWFLPKYRFQWTSHPLVVLGGSFAERLDVLGLEPQTMMMMRNLKSGDDNEVLVFSTKGGSAYGDFAIENVKINVYVHPPKNVVQIEYGAMMGVAFDTGDLWDFANRIKDALEARG